MKIVSLGSGSRGNATLLEIDGKFLLIDNGFTLRETERRLLVPPKEISSLLLTHEHSDHVEGVGAFCNKYGVVARIPEVLCSACRERLDGVEVVPHTDNTFIVDGIEITPFRVPHDARYTVGYKIVKGEESFAIVTDLGEARKSVLEQLKGVKRVVLESNYDPEMLEQGSYPEMLKRRIKGKLGHLSNSDAANLALTLAENGVEQIILAHVSENNNAPEIAFDVTQKVLSEFQSKTGKKILLGVAEQDKVKIF